ncbi:SDR family oxidoreductase [Ectobacillus sp. JY-23]|uniref:SDR family oxidoreductase n=1 Tax=Ectobacillus sp. JY-23 TaxID=2933872 RepID=UPI001FF4BCD3|nr:SDR family oxidoreductase [Ectobacillus sp. JY-23]UOY92631.1 SDR family oxidoreductase [Ectobacillus sp. JY-23]
MNTYFLTGFPGFIAKQLVAQIQKDHIVSHMYMLVLPSMLKKAEAAVPKGLSYTLLPGDITKENLGLSHDTLAMLRETVTHVFHLAAVYDLAISKQIAYEVNVKGTANMNTFCQSLHHLQRYTYFSTAYVAGMREGDIFETELVMGQVFKNFYEQTKYEAEVLVDQLKEVLPITIIRPGIVVGHSTTGETAKFDGPYFILNVFHALRHIPLLPYIGRGLAEGNFVPVDFIIQATSYLSHHAIGVGKTYQLTDPRPYTVKEVYRMLMREFLGREPKFHIRLAYMRRILSFPRARRLLRTEKEALDYFICKARYRCDQTTADLQHTNIACPDFKDVVPRIVAYYKEHRDNQAKHITIR